MFFCHPTTCKNTIHSFMFKYHILIKFTNLIPTLKKKIPFLKLQAWVLPADASLCSVPPMSPGPRQPATCLYPIKTLPKMVKSWKVLHIFVYEHCPLFLETLNICNHQCPSPELIPFRVRKLSMNCRGVPVDRLSPFTVLPWLSVTKLLTIY